MTNNTRPVQNPCEKCKRSKCPEVCFPKRDYYRALQKRFRKAMKEKGNI